MSLLSLVRSPRAWAFVTSCALSGIACTSEERTDRPPLVSSGCTSDCPGSSTSAGGGGGAGGESSSIGTLTGHVFEYVDSLLDGVKASGVDGDVLAYSTGTASSLVSIDIIGGSYTLNEVDMSVQGFLAVVPVDAGVYVTTMTTGDTSDGEEDITIVPRDLLEEVYLAKSINPRVDRGTVAVRFIDGNGDAVPGVSVTSSDAESVLYRNLTTYDPVATSTSSDSFVVLLNMTSAEFPGRFGSVAWSKSGGGTGTITVRVADDAITFVTVKL